MTAAHIVSAAVTAGAWTLIPAALLAAAWAVTRSCTWAWRLTAAARQWQRDTRTDPAGSSISDAELADVIAIWADDYRDQQREEQ
jgi:hypothetical protein